MSKTSRTPYKKRITKKRRASDAERGRKKKQVSGVATANSLDNCEQTVDLVGQLAEAKDFCSRPRT